MENKTDAWEWVQGSTKQTLSPLAKNVCDALHFMGHGGIYNRPISFDRVNWSRTDMIELNWCGDLANWDGSGLTALWGWCAENMLRVEICPSSPRHLKLRFWQRKTREGGMSERLPNHVNQLKFVGIDIN